MMSLRSFSRALPRSLPRISPRCSTLRSFSAIPRPFVQQHTSNTFPRQRSIAAFSTSRVAWEKEGQVDQELSAKIESELQMEQEMRDTGKMPASISEYLDSSSFELHDTPGHEEVVLTRKFGDENIRVSFSIADLNASMEQDDTFDDDKALYDENDPTDMDAANSISAQSGGANMKGSTTQGRTPDGNLNMSSEISAAPSGREEAMDDDDSAPGRNSDSMEDDDSEPSFPARINVMIEKAGKGTLQIETTAQDGEVVIDNVLYFANAELADAQTAEMDWKRRNLYEGPPFANLDEDLQVLLERYLDERGVNTALALWVPEYIDFKEQREYLGWLSNVKTFVDA